MFGPESSDCKFIVQGETNEAATYSAKNTQSDTQKTTKHRRELWSWREGFLGVSPTKTIDYNRLQTIDHRPKQGPHSIVPSSAGTTLYCSLPNRDHTLLFPPQQGPHSIVPTPAGTTLYCSHPNRDHTLLFPPQHGPHSIVPSQTGTTLYCSHPNRDHTLLFPPQQGPHSIVRTPAGTTLYCSHPNRDHTLLFPPQQGPDSIVPSQTGTTLLRFKEKPQQNPVSSSAECFGNKVGRRLTVQRKVYSQAQQHQRYRSHTQGIRSHVHNRSQVIQAGLVPYILTRSARQDRRGAPNRLPQSNARRLSGSIGFHQDKTTGSNCTQDIRSYIGQYTIVVYFWYNSCTDKTQIHILNIRW